MPPASKKDCSVILLDMNSKFKEKAIQTLMKICCNKYFASSKDITKLVLFNTEKTSNCLSARYGSCYEHIFEHENIIKYNPGLIMNLIEKVEACDGNNWVEALAVGIEILKKEFQCIGGVITLQLLLITDLSVPLSHQASDTEIDDIIQDLNENEIFLYIVGPNVEIPFTLKNLDDIKKWRKTITFNETEENFQLVKKVVETTENTIVCDCKIGIQLFFVYKKWGGKQPWCVPLSIGSKIHIPTQTMKVVMSEGSNIKLVADKNAFSERIWIDAEDETKEIDPQTVIGGVLRHEKFVPISDEKMFKCDGPRCFNILGFTESSSIPEYYMRGDGCYYVLPKNASTPKINEAFNALIDCLAEQDKYAVARRVYNNCYVPKFVVLVPKPNFKPKCFILSELPYSDDIRVDYKPNSINTVSIKKENKCDEVYKFLDSIDVDGGGNEINVPLGIPLMQDINVDKIINSAADKHLDKHLNLQELDLNYFNFIVSDELLDDFQKIWPERQIAKSGNDQNKSDAEDDFD